jgi:predicted RNase H-like nuclease (RuvC/YqgF family)
MIGGSREFREHWSEKMIEQLQAENARLKQQVDELRAQVEICCQVCATTMHSTAEHWQFETVKLQCTLERVRALSKSLRERDALADLIADELDQASEAKE